MIFTKEEIKAKVISRIAFSKNKKKAKKAFRDNIIRFLEKELENDSNYEPYYSPEVFMEPMAFRLISGKNDFLVDFMRPFLFSSPVELGDKNLIEVQT
mmetsp:Transcript_19055/g.29236  ORF Transcript_19055/g.29236 Transcript_19055/m.29236 type:complete len:98 (-) Transcript_19055:2428-2721(-)